MVQFTVDAQFDGNEELRAVLEGLGDRVLQVGGGAIFREGNDIMNASKEIVPVLDRDLLNSGHAHPPEMMDGGIVVTLSYGGPSVDYAVLQHETPPSVFRHREGKTWKFLERPAYEATRGMGQRIAGFIRARLGRELG